jgi:hypothetical protein
MLERGKEMWVRLRQTHTGRLSRCIPRRVLETEIGVDCSPLDQPDCGSIHLSREQTRAIHAHSRYDIPW